MTKLLLCACTLVAACLFGVAAPAQAALSGCVTVAEYRQVHKGMTRRAVHRLFDTYGRQVVFHANDGFTSEVRRYRGCPRQSVVSVAYGNGRVRSKAAIWSP